MESTNVSNPKSPQSFAWFAKGPERLALEPVPFFMLRIQVAWPPWRDQIFFEAPIRIPRTGQTISQYKPQSLGRDSRGLVPCCQSMSKLMSLIIIGCLDISLAWLV